MSIPKDPGELPGVAQRFAKGDSKIGIKTALFEFTLQDGFPILPITSQPGVANDHESEVLLPRGSTLVIKTVKAGPGDQMRISAEVLAPCVGRRA